MVRRQGIKRFPIAYVSKGSMDDRSVRRRESARCWIIFCGLLRVIEKCTVRIHGRVHKIIASCVGVSYLVPGGVMGFDVCADPLVYFGVWLVFRQ